jgi:hypothetical protein
MQSPVLESQILRVSSDEAETIWRPSGLQAQDMIQSECPESVLVQRAVFGSHSFSVSSHEAESIWRPSGLQAHDMMKLECPESV